MPRFAIALQTVCIILVGVHARRPLCWLTLEVRPEDGHKYCAYSLLYVDDILLVVHHDRHRSLNEVDHFFKAKDGSMSDPEFYLGAKLRQTTLPGGVRAWSMSSTSKYIQAAVANVKDYHRLHFLAKPTMGGAKEWSFSFKLRS